MLPPQSLCRMVEVLIANVADAGFLPIGRERPCHPIYDHNSTETLGGFVVDNNAMYFVCF